MNRCSDITSTATGTIDVAGSTPTVGGPRLAPQCGFRGGNAAMTIPA
jgi:hypothetical protein